MIARSALAGLMLMTVGCAAVPPAVEAAPRGQGCDASRVQGLVGQPGSEALATEARRRAGASTVRMLRPGDIVTLEYLAERLNIDLDQRGRVTGFRCG